MHDKHSSRNSFNKVIKAELILMLATDIFYLPLFNLLFAFSISSA